MLIRRETFECEKCDRKVHFETFAKKKVACKHCKGEMVLTDKQVVDISITS